MLELFWKKFEEPIHRQWDVLMTARKGFFSALGLAAVIGGVCGFSLASYLDSKEVSAANADRDLARNCREAGSKAPPCPTLPAPTSKQIDVRLAELSGALKNVMANQPFKVPPGYPEAGSVVRFRRTNMGIMILGTPTEQEKQLAQFQSELDASSDPLVQTLLRGTFFNIPKGYPFEGEAGAVTPVRFTTVNERSGPCFDIVDSKVRVTGKSDCSGHKTGWKVRGRSDVEAENPSVKP